MLATTQERMVAEILADSQVASVTSSDGFAHEAPRDLTKTAQAYLIVWVPEGRADLVHVTCPPFSSDSASPRGRNIHAAVLPRAQAVLAAVGFRTELVPHDYGRDHLVVRI